MQNLSGAFDHEMYAYRKAHIQARVWNGDLYEEYADYVMVHSPGDRLICNGDMLIDAMEAGYLQDEFIDHMARLM